GDGRQAVVDRLRHPGPLLPAARPLDRRHQGVQRAVLVPAAEDPGGLRLRPHEQRNCRSHDVKTDAAAIDQPLPSTRSARGTGPKPIGPAGQIILPVATAAVAILLWELAV